MPFTKRFCVITLCFYTLPFVLWLRKNVLNMESTLFGNCYCLKLEKKNYHLQCFNLQRKRKALKFVVVSPIQEKWNRIITTFGEHSCGSWAGEVFPSSPPLAVHLIRWRTWPFICKSKNFADNMFYIQHYNDSSNVEWKCQQGKCSRFSLKCNRYSEVI